MRSRLRCRGTGSALMNQTSSFADARHQVLFGNDLDIMAVFFAALMMSPRRIEEADDVCRWACLNKGGRYENMSANLRQIYQSSSSSSNSERCPDMLNASNTASAMSSSSALSRSPRIVPAWRGRMLATASIAASNRSLSV